MAKPTTPVDFIIPCKFCSDWKLCQGHWYNVDTPTGRLPTEYYYLDEIRYCRQQVPWIVKEFLIVDGDRIVMERETWPGDIYVSGYTEAERTSHAVRANPPGQSVVLAVSELARRLERTGQGGHDLVSQLRSGATLGQGSRDALNYALGGRAKTEGFDRWLAQRERRNEAKKASFSRIA